LTTLAPVDVLWRKKNRKSTKFRVLDKVPEGSALFLNAPVFLYTTVQEKPRIASVPKTSSIHSAVLLHYRRIAIELQHTPRYVFVEYATLAEKRSVF